MISFFIPPITLEIVEGDIAAEHVDAVVNAANTHFWMGAGVAGALKARGGGEIERDAVAQGPVEPGESVVTAGHRLAARYVIHAAVMGQDLRTSEPLVRLATKSALAEADRLGIVSVALPALGTGVGGFPLDACARTMIGVVQTFAERAASVRTVRLVLFGSRAYQAFAETARILLAS